MGSGTFTIEGRSAPALFVVGWLATLVGAGLVAVGLLSGGGKGSIALFVIGLFGLSVGLIAAAGAQAIERRARAVPGYAGPSPFLVFAAAVPVSLLIGIAIAIPLGAFGLSLDGPFGALLSVAIQAIVYVAVIRLLVVDTGALDWRAMGLRPIDRGAILEIASGALWALPVIVATIPVAGILVSFTGVSPESPLPPTGTPTGFAISFVAAVLVAPLGEEILFRGFATTAWVRRLGKRRGLLRAALLFAFVHVLPVSGASAGDAIGLAVVGFGTRIPIAVALGWLFLRRGSIWSAVGLHAAFNAVLLVIAELSHQAL